MWTAWMFDGIIFGFLILSGALLIHAWHHWNRFRYKRLVGIATVVLALGWITVFYGSFVESNLLTTRETPVILSSATPESSETIRVAVVSDIHLGPYHGVEWSERVVETTMALHPDLILLPGDFISFGPKEAEGLAPLKALSAPLGVFAVTGNHEYEHGADKAVVEILEQSGITVLQNTSRSIAVDDKVLALIGVSDIWFAGDLLKAFEGVSDETPTILLAHNPDVVLLEEASRADITIAGHTHGGQIRLPFFGSVPSIPDKLGRAYDRGLFTYGNGQLFVTSGVGTSGPRARLFNPPVVDLLTLTF